MTDNDRDSLAQAMMSHNRSDQVFQALIVLMLGFQSFLIWNSERKADDRFEKLCVSQSVNVEHRESVHESELKRILREGQH